MSLKDFQDVFYREYHDKGKQIPDMDLWASRIRLVIPSGAIYLIIWKYVDDAGSDIKFLFLKPCELDWSGAKSKKTNDSEYRSEYFHKSNADSNIWILKKNYRYDENLIRSLIKDKDIKV